MATSFDLSGTPPQPGIYLLEDFNGNVAYVGISKDLRARMNQHFIRKDSSVTTGVSAACLNTESVRKAKWWLDPRLEQLVWREAAELVAFDLFQPTLRSLGGISEAAKHLHSQSGFAESVREMLTKEPAGEFYPLNLRNLLARVEELETRLQGMPG